MASLTQMAKDEYEPPPCQTPSAAVYLYISNGCDVSNRFFFSRQLPICTDEFVKSGHCNTTDIGEFVVSHNATEKSNALILTKAVHLKDAGPIHYSLKKTGYYCVVTQGYTIDKYNAVVEFRNAYGELQATQIPKLPFYGAMSIIYALMAGYWGFLYYQHRHDICMSRSLHAFLRRRIPCRNPLTHLQWRSKTTLRRY